jgi:hypothetical protein
MKKEMGMKCLQDMQELSVESCQMIHGGQAFLYWIYYVTGSLMSGITGEVDSSQRLYHAALN